MNFMTDSPSDQIDQHLKDVDAAISHGGSVSEGFERIREGWFAAKTDAIATDLQDTILRAITSGDPEAVEQAMVHASVATLDRSYVRGRLARVVLLSLRAAYAETASGNYTAIAEQYDATAHQLTVYAEQVDITASADTIVRLDNQARTAWTEASVLAVEMDALLEVLVDAARLVGIPFHDSDGVRIDGTFIALACDPGTAHRRRVFEAWESYDRCGRWAALLALGVSLRAAPLDGFQTYRSPRPLIVRHVPSRSTGFVGIKMLTVDPEDADYKPVSPEPEMTTGDRIRDAAFDHLCGSDHDK